jgi:hypothetical protein
MMLSGAGSAWLGTARRNSREGAFFEGEVGTGGAGYWNYLNASVDHRRPAGELPPFGDTLDPLPGVRLPAIGTPTSC